MPKSKNRKKHNEKKKAYRNSVLAAAKLQKHRMNKYLEYLNSELLKKREEEANKEQISDNSIQDAVIIEETKNVIENE